MKKLLIGILIGIVVASLYGCDVKDLPVEETVDFVTETTSTISEIVFPEGWENMSEEYREDWLSNSKSNVYFGRVDD